MLTMPAMMNGEILVTVPFNKRQNWQNSDGSGPYQTLNKSNPATTDENVANQIFNIDISDMRFLLLHKDFETYQEIAARYQLINCSPKACRITVHFIDYKTECKIRQVLLGK